MEGPHGSPGAGFGRRRLLQYAVGSAAAAALARLYGCSPSSDDDAANDGVAVGNVLVLVADDQRFDTLEVMPTLQRLQKVGTTFTQARQSASLCSPARASMLRGQYAAGPDGHGVQTNDDRLTRDQEDDALAAWLDAAGYHCGLAGKYFDSAQAQRVPTGWSWWRAFVKGQGSGDDLAPIQHAENYGVFDGETTVYPAQHQMEYLTSQVLDFIETAPEPWFLWDCPTSPHNPPEPTPRRAREPVETEWPVVGEDTSGKPAWVAAMPALDDGHVAITRAMIAKILREVIDVDDHLAALWKRLRDTGLADRTTVIYTSDNGVALLDYRLPPYLKNLPYDVSSHVPLICVGPDFPADAVIDAPVSVAVDITASCLAIARAEATQHQEGVSLHLTASEAHDRAARVVPGSCAPRAIPPAVPGSAWVVADRGAGLRKLIRYQGVSGGDEYEAYDLDSDPDELHNWANDATRRAERDDLEAALDEATA
jgi:arylsulfatase A-like enzyme